MQGFNPRLYVTSKSRLQINQNIIKLFGFNTGCQTQFIDTNILCIHKIEGNQISPSPARDEILKQYQTHITTQSKINFNIIFKAEFASTFFNGVFQAWIRRVLCTWGGLDKMREVFRALNVLHLHRVTFSRAKL